MTAEIAIMNREAVALAADSAETVNFPDGPKIYNSVSKLFMLSKYAPVGVMVFGATDLTGVPWETIIKSFRRELGEERLPHLREYADRLIAYINGNKIMFSEELQEEQLVDSVRIRFQSILRDIKQIKETIAARGPINDKKARAIMMASTRDTIRDAHSIWTSAEQLPSVPANHAQRIRQKWQRQIEDVIDTDFKEFLPIDSTTRSRLMDIACLVFTTAWFPDDISGVVVAGFGEDEYLPSVVSFDIEGVLLDFVRVRVNEEKSATTTPPGLPAHIISFAQDEMVHLFTEGADQFFQSQILGALRELIGDLADVIVTSTNATGRRERTLRKQVDQAGEAVTNRFVEHLGSYMVEHYQRPVLSAVVTLPKEELAAMAGSLVSLTSFKRRVTYEAETVGGPIDVAVISKGDGFIWINRKHYFDPSLNHHFFANYWQFL